MDKQTIDTYNKMAREYDEETKGFWDAFPDEFLQTFAHAIVPKGRVLDVGSGPGRDALLLQKKGLDVVCLDASQAMVEIAKEKGLEAVQGDFLELPFEDEAFDGVWAYTSLLHVPKAMGEKAVQEIRRVLKPNGVFGLGLIEGTTEEYRESSGVNMPRFFAYYTKEELEQLLGKFGFRIAYFNTLQPRSKTYLHLLSRKQ